MAQQQQSKPYAGENKASRQRQIIPPTHVVIDPPFPTVNYAQNQPTNAPTQSPEKPLPRFLRPEWVIVYITAMYAVINGLAFWAIRRQADIMDRQAKAMQGQLREMQEAGKLASRQAGVMEGQLDEMKKAGSLIQGQLAVMQGQLKAMQDQVELFISKERAWLRIAVEHVPLPTEDKYLESFAIRYLLQHYGPTDAIIIDSATKALLTNSEDVPLDTDVIGLGPASQVVKPSQAPLREHQPIWRQADFMAPTMEDIDGLKKGTHFIHFWGFWSYKDVFGKTRVTKFRFLYKLSPLLYGTEKRLLMLPQKHGPAEDTGET